MIYNVSDVTYKRVWQLVQDCALAYGRTCSEVLTALGSSRGMREAGHGDADHGHFSEESGRAAIRVLEYWIGAKG